MEHIFIPFSAVQHGATGYDTAICFWLKFLIISKMLLVEPLCIQQVTGG